MPVLIRRLDVCKARIPVADAMGAHCQRSWQVAKEFAANNVCVPGAASTVQKGLSETLSAVLVRQPVDDDAGVLAVEPPSSELHRHRYVSAARHCTQPDKLVLRRRMPRRSCCRDRVKPELHAAVSCAGRSSLLDSPDMRREVSDYSSGDL